MLVPKLRFKREDGTEYPEWESKTLQEVTSHFQSGKAINRSNIAQTGKYAVYGGNGLRGFTDSYNHCGDYVLIGRQGALCGNVCFVSGKNYFTEHAIAVQANSENYLPFLLYQFDNMNLGQYSGQSAQAGLAVSRITQVTANFPHIEEQQKIADFLSTVDEVIAQSEAEVQNLEQQKKAAMQKIFSQEVRFKREDGTEYLGWASKHISEFANCFAGATPSTKVKAYWENGTISWLSSGEVNKKQIFETDKRISQLGFEKCSTKMVKPNSVVMALAGQGKTRGTVAITRIPVCTNQSLCAIETDDSIVDDYLYQYLRTRYDDLRNISSGDGTRGGLNLKLINDYLVSVPCLEEQQKIADFLSAYDEAISYAKQELDKWKELKKGLLQQMFV